MLQNAKFAKKNPEFVSKAKYTQYCRCQMVSALGPFGLRWVSCSTRWTPSTCACEFPSLRRSLNPSQSAGGLGESLLKLLVYTCFRYVLFHIRFCFCTCLHMVCLWINQCVVCFYHFRAVFFGFHNQPADLPGVDQVAGTMVLGFCIQYMAVGTREKQTSCHGQPKHQVAEPGRCWILALQSGVWICGQGQCANPSIQILPKVPEIHW